MAYFDDIPKKGDKASTTTQVKTTGYFSDIPKKEPSKIKEVGKNVLAGILKTPARYATNAVQAYQIATGKPQTEPFSGEFLGRVAPMGTGETFRQQVGDAIGGGIELASYIPVARSAKIGYQASKTGLPFVIKELAKEGAVGGLLGSTGSGIQEAAVENKQINPSDIVKATAFGAFLNPLIGVSARYIGQKLGNKPPVKVDVTSETTGGFPNLVTPRIKYDKYRKEMGYEPYLSTEELPTIEMGPKKVDESGLPVIQMEPRKTGIKSEFSYDPITTIINKGKNAPELIKQATETIQEVTPPARLETPTQETFVPELARDVETEAIRNNLVSRFEGLPEAQVMNMERQAQEAQSLVNTDYEFAKRVALGEQTPPGELRDASVFEAVKLRALKDQDVDTLKRLATESTIPSKVSAYAQQVKAADTRLFDTNDPVEMMQTVVKAREKGMKIKKKDVAVKDKQSIQQAINKNLPKKEDWESFINSIEC